MHRLIAAALFAGAFGLGPAALAQEAMVGIDAGNDSFLYGSLLKPPGEAPAPFVLIVPASSALDRNGDSTAAGPQPGTYKLLAEALAAKGIGSLRTDRRGVAGSAAALGDESAVTLDTYVDDAVAWAKFLALQPRVKCVWLMGHSEGALVAALAAQKVKTCGVIEAAGAGRPAGDMIAAQLKAAENGGSLSEGAYDQAMKIMAELRAGRRVADVPLALDSLFRPSLQPYLISWLGRDPVAAQANLYPVLVLQGDHDAQVSVDDARLLANVSRAIRLVILPNADHALKVVADKAPADEGADDAAPLAPGAAPAIAEFIANPPQQVRTRK
jgi:alpha-beta hydrolase superfamily lysophospholipase